MLELHYPVSPVKVIQPFGNNPLNPDGTSYYARFLDKNGNPYKGHMGMDLQAAHATKLYAPVAGQAMYSSDPHGGDGIIIHTPDNYNIIFWHLCPKDDPQFPIQIPCDGAWHPVKLGDFLGYTDNSGAPFESSGDHLHVGLCPTDANWQPLHPDNGYGGCIDPQPFFVAPQAIAAPVIAEVVQEAATIVQEVAQSPAPVSEKQMLLNALKVVIEKIEELL